MLLYFLAFDQWNSISHLPNFQLILSILLHLLLKILSFLERFYQNSRMDTTQNVSPSQKRKKREKKGKKVGINERFSPPKLQTERHMLVSMHKSQPLRTKVTVPRMASKAIDASFDYSSISFEVWFSSLLLS